MTVVEAWSGRLSCGHNILCNPGHLTVLPSVGYRSLCRRCARWGELTTVRSLRLTRLRRLVCPRRWAVALPWTPPKITDPFV